MVIRLPLPYEGTDCVNGPSEMNIYGVGYSYMVSYKSRWKILACMHYFLHFNNSTRFYPMATDVMFSSLRKVFEKSCDGGTVRVIVNRLENSN